MIGIILELLILLSIEGTYMVIASVHGESTIIFLLGLEIGICFYLEVLVLFLFNGLL
jgi:hypothetical protein